MINVVEFLPSVPSGRNNSLSQTEASLTSIKKSEINNFIYLKSFVYKNLFDGVKRVLG